jgi:hypothetical protein
MTLHTYSIKPVSALLHVHIQRLKCVQAWTLGVVARLLFDVPCGRLVAHVFLVLQKIVLHLFPELWCDIKLRLHKDLCLRAHIHTHTQLMRDKKQCAILNCLSKLHSTDFLLIRLPAHGENEIACSFVYPEVDWEMQKTVLSIVLDYLSFYCYTNTPQTKQEHCENAPFWHRPAE